MSSARRTGPSRDLSIPGEEIPVITAHRTIVIVDIAGFGLPSRNNANLVRVRHGMYQSIEQAFNSVGIPWTMCQPADTGDGVRVLAPADIPKPFFVNYLPSALVKALIIHNKAHPASEKIRMRLALHAGEISYDAHGATGAAITHTFRLLDSDAFKRALAESSAVLAIISSDWFYDEVIRHSELSHARSYRPIEVTNKETVARAWVRLVNARGRPLPRSPRSPCVRLQ